MNSSRFEAIFSDGIVTILRTFFIEKEDRSRYVSQRHNYLENVMTWRNFLSTHHSLHWCSMRKKHYYWKLNSVYSSEYFRNNQFQVLVQSKLVNPLNQLYLSIPVREFQYEADWRFSNLLGLELLGDTLDVFPRLENIQHVTVRIFEFELQSDKIVLGPNIRSYSRIYEESPIDMEQEGNDGLISLSGVTINILPQIKLSSLMYLSVKLKDLNYGVEFPVEFTDAVFPSLVNLSIRNESESFYEFIIDFIALTNLKKLSLYHVKVQSINKCTSLESIDLASSTILGRIPMAIKNRLKELQGWDELQIDFEDIPNLRSLDLTTFQYSNECVPLIKDAFPKLTTLGISLCDSDTFYINRTIRNLRINYLLGKVTYEDDPSLPPHPFTQIMLTNCKLTDYSYFRRAQDVYIVSCDISDISLIAHVPSLTLIDCKNINDFSCLGNYTGSRPRFVIIKKCNLKDSDLIYLRDIYSLDISENELLTNLDNLRGNVILRANNNSFEEVQLIKQYYNFLDLTGCQRLKSVMFFTISPSNPEEKVIVDLTKDKEKFIVLFKMKRRNYYTYSHYPYYSAAQVFIKDERY